MAENNYGIWIGENATVAVTDKFQISFLRVEKDLIVSVLHYNTYGTVGVVYGFGVNFNAHALTAVRNPASRNEYINSDEAKLYLQNHSADKTEYDAENGKLLYTMYDCEIFELVLSEKIEMADFDKTNEIDGTLPFAKRMALWNVGKFFEYSDEKSYINVQIDTKKYSVLFSTALSGDWVYCRVGQNGYCEKGWAMLSTVCIRQNETRMIENNLLSINAYRPVEECFIVDGCSFPPDGGWYWSVKEVTDDVIYLNGCGGATYEIHRR